MSIKADAWVLYAGEDAQRPEPARLVRETWEFAELQEDEVLCDPLAGCWEGNMGHALQRRPVDICRERREPRVVIGNAGVVRVVDVGRSVRTVEPGQRAVIFCNGEEDPWGYPRRILAYDAPGTMGVLATRMKVRARQVIPVPQDSPYSIYQWAAFSLRYVTAWSNFEMAQGVFRLLVPWDEMASPHVWGWGGGVTLAELDLARRHGCRTVMLSSNEQRLRTIAQTGVAPLDRRRFGDLNYDEERYRADPVFKKAYREAEEAFLEEVRRRTRGQMVQIFIDYIGAPVWRATLKALSREGVVTTAGWKEGMQLSAVRAIECIERHQHVHTHYARYPQGLKAVAYAEANGWMPMVDQRVWTFDEIPDLAASYAADDVNCYPTFSVNQE